MNIARYALTLALVLLAACGSSQSDDGEPPLGPGAEAGRISEGPPPVVMGMVKDASTGAPVVGALIQAPDGTQILSEAGGRFVLRGLALGTEGVLEVLTEDGRKGQVHLRPLASGELEVVLYVR